MFVNNQLVGKHSGGYLPFWFDITDYLAEGEAQNELLVSVWDPTDTHWQQRGKQVLKPKSIWYTAVSGIWQTVWLEPVPQTYISGLKITPDVDAGTIRVKANLIGPGTDSSVVYCSGCLTPGRLWRKGKQKMLRRDNDPISQSEIMESQLTASLRSGSDRGRGPGRAVTLGCASSAWRGGRLCLNGAPLFQFGPLDQGYWPDGLYTPPTDEAMRQDIELVKGLGLQHASQARQGGTEALLLLLRPDWADRLAGHAERR